MNWKHWLHGLGAAFIGGFATALAATQVDAKAFNLSGDGLMNLLKLGLFSGILNAAFYLKQSPLPVEEKASPINPVTALALLAIPIFLMGCGTLDPNGPYKGDRVLYTADKTIVESYDLMHSFVQWEYQNRPALSKWPEIKESANAIRREAKGWIESAEAMRDAYALHPDDQTRNDLLLSLDLLKTALAQAANYMKEAK